MVWTAMHRSRRKRHLRGRRPPNVASVAAFAVALVLGPTESSSLHFALPCNSWWNARSRRRRDTRVCARRSLHDADPPDGYALGLKPLEKYIKKGQDFAVPDVNGAVDHHDDHHRNMSRAMMMQQQQHDYDPLAAVHGNPLFGDHDHHNNTRQRSPYESVANVTRKLLDAGTLSTQNVSAPHDARRDDTGSSVHNGTTTTSARGGLADVGRAWNASSSLLPIRADFFNVASGNTEKNNREAPTSTRNATAALNATTANNNVTSATTNGKTKSTVKPALSPSFTKKKTSSTQNAQLPRESKKQGTQPHGRRTNTSNLEPEFLMNITGKNVTETVTFQDLELILRVAGYVKQGDIDALKSPTGDILEGVGLPVSGQQRSYRGEGVAFPQPSVLSYRSVKWGTTTVSCGLGGVVGLSLLPNLWLMGALAGGFYGFRVGQKVETQKPDNVVDNALVTLGRRLARLTLKLKDMAYTLVFVLKTGQLSYDYWKRYAELDKKYSIQDKLDAWNSFFSDGKVKFDQWEQENEIGRKMVAGLRTAWLVEERSMRREGMQRRYSRYRVVQVFYDLLYGLKQFFRNITGTFRGEGNSAIRDFWNGLSIDLAESRLGAVWTRAGSAVAALIVFNLVGALFTISPTLLCVVAIATGVFWPFWPQELYERMILYFKDMSAQGRGDESTDVSTMSRLPRRNDQTRFSYFVRPDGTKHFFRVGQPWKPLWATTNDDREKERFPWLKNNSNRRNWLDDLLGRDSQKKPRAARNKG